MSVGHAPTPWGERGASQLRDACCAAAEPIHGSGEARGSEGSVYERVYGITGSVNEFQIACHRVSALWRSLE